MYQSTFHSESDNLYSKIREFCDRNEIRVEVSAQRRRPYNYGGSGYDIYDRYSDGPSTVELTMRIEVLAALINDIERLNQILNDQHSEERLLDNNPGLAEMYEEYKTFKALCEQKRAE